MNRRSTFATTTTAIFAGFALALTACGGGSDSAEPAAPADEPAGGATPADTNPAAEPASEPAPEPATEEPAAEPAPSDDAAGANTAVVTIGDQRFEFDVTPSAIQRCDPNFFGSFWALGSSTAGDGIELNLIPEDDPNFDDVTSLRVNDAASESTWLADPNQDLPGVEPGMSQVDSWVVEGARATGTATFVDQEDVYKFQGGTGDAPTSVAGTFEVSCAT